MKGVLNSVDANAKERRHCERALVGVRKSQV